MRSGLSLTGQSRREATQKRDALFVQAWNASQSVDEAAAKTTALLEANRFKGYGALVSRITALKLAKRLRGLGTQLKRLDGETKKWEVRKR